MTEVGVKFIVLEASEMSSDTIHAVNRRSALAAWGVRRGEKLNVQKIHCQCGNSRDQLNSHNWLH